MELVTEEFSLLGLLLLLLLLVMASGAREEISAVAVAGLVYVEVEGFADVLIGGGSVFNLFSPSWRSLLLGDNSVRKSISLLVMLL